MSSLTGVCKGLLGRYRCIGKGPGPVCCYTKVNVPCRPWYSLQVLCRLRARPSRRSVPQAPMHLLEHPPARLTSLPGHLTHRETTSCSQQWKAHHRQGQTLQQDQQHFHCPRVTQESSGFALPEVHSSAFTHISSDLVALTHSFLAAERPSDHMLAACMQPLGRSMCVKGSFNITAQGMQATWVRIPHGPWDAHARHGQLSIYIYMHACNCMHVIHAEPPACESQQRQHACAPASSMRPSQGVLPCSTW